jgi:D-beta-D-heptose 7-phosphate kinase/D-beta-D-heptose 1-phosphate adenosyltransferase
LHKGHVDYLQKAKKLGDRLIVAVNTDESVRHLKGNERPIVPLNERMEVLSALECVDWVVAFKEETPQRLISYLLPDILVKGADYEIDEIAGAKEVLENGGEVKTISLVDGCSTSSIVERIKSLSR